MNRTYDLEERLLEYSTRIIRFAETLHKTDAGRHVTRQLLRSGTSPMAQHGEAQSAESPEDFVHKLSIGLKELRETLRWLKLAERVPLTRQKEDTQALIKEIDELIRIFFSSIRTARKPEAAA